MDPVVEIKARLPIEDLVGQYCQLKKKGRGFVCVCPFHNDTHPSMQVSPDKGIAYCFACSSGGDVFSFYQKIEGVDFRQAVKDLAERTGVKIEGMALPRPEQKEHKERLRDCLESALRFYRASLSSHPESVSYLQKRGIPEEQIEAFELGFAPNSFSDTYQHLLKEGFSRGEIVDASLGIQKELSEGKIYDRFRNRIMFPIRDAHGDLVGFGGRTIGDDDAKYINSGETELYSKSAVLFGLHLAKEAVRETKRIILVEGYFDVLACHRVGVKNAVAVSGTALTESHVKMLKRIAESVVLCLDQDRAGKDAAERAFYLCAPEGLSIRAVEIAGKDPDEAAAANPATLASALQSGGVPYLDLIVSRLSASDRSTADGKREVAAVLFPLIKALPSAVEREHYIGKAAALLSTTPVAVEEDMQRIHAAPKLQQELPQEGRDLQSGFAPAEVALGMLCLFPTLRILISELIEPEGLFLRELYHAIRKLDGTEEVSVESLRMPPECVERAAVLLLFCEHHGFAEWSETLAAREIRKNCAHANREFLRKKQREIAEKLGRARSEGKTAEEEKLSTEYQEVLKLAKMAVR
ncbi:DNA primase [Candidatus Peregrinibacteria bacterium]|nr:DNA primase [Candidatus Peregrinibacteria bacterium]